jgi:hypothetical protein
MNTKPHLGALLSSKQEPKTKKLQKPESQNPTRQCRSLQNETRIKPQHLHRTGEDGGASTYATRIQIAIATSICGGRGGGSRIANGGANPSGGGETMNSATRSRRVGWMGAGRAGKWARA